MEGRSPACAGERYPSLMLWMSIGCGNAFAFAFAFAVFCPSRGIWPIVAGMYKVAGWSMIRSQIG
jgi:hypothetical protein